MEEWHEVATHGSLCSVRCIQEKGNPGDRDWDFAAGGRSCGCGGATVFWEDVKIFESLEERDGSYNFARVQKTTFLTA